MIVTLAIVKEEIGRTDDLHDEMIVRKINEATAIVLDYLKLDADEYEDATGANDVPVIVGAAIIKMARYLYDQPDADPLTEGIQNILHRLRDPAMA